MLPLMDVAFLPTETPSDDNVSPSCSGAGQDELYPYGASEPRIFVGAISLVAVKPSRSILD